MYRCVATSEGGFIQQLAVQYVVHGYWFYILGNVPMNKDPAQVDQKLIERYGVDRSSAQRSRRKAAGLANVQYLRYDRQFVLLATHGRHAIFEQEAMRDLRRSPLQVLGYSISYRGGHASVRIGREEYQELRARLQKMAVRRGCDELEAVFRGLPYEPYAPVRGQVSRILGAVNRARKAAGLERVPYSAVRKRRRVYRPFESTGPARVRWTPVAGGIRETDTPRSRAARQASSTW